MNPFANLCIICVPVHIIIPMKRLKGRKFSKLITSGPTCCYPRQKKLQKVATRFIIRRRAKRAKDIYRENDAKFLRLCLHRDPFSSKQNTLYVWASMSGKLSPSAKNRRETARFFLIPGAINSVTEL